MIYIIERRWQGGKRELLEAFKTRKEAQNKIGEYLGNDEHECSGLAIVEVKMNNVEIVKQLSHNSDDKEGMK